MPIRIDPNKPKNIKFLEFIIGKIKEKEGFELENAVDIKIQKGITPFPVFEKTKPSENIDTTAYEAMQDANKDYDQEAENIGKYLCETFGKDIEMMSPMRTNENPLTFTMVVVVNNRHGIYKIAEELKRKKPKNKQSKTQKKDKESKLLTKPLRIAFRGKEIPVRERTIQGDVCKLMLRKPLNTIIELDQIVDKVYGKDVENPKTKLKNIENAFYLINSKVKKSTGKSIFSYGSKRFIKIA